MKTKRPPKPHKNTPQRLVRLWRKHNYNYYKTAQEIEIATSWVWQLIRFGIEPKRLDLRRKLFLTRQRSPEELEEIRKRKQDQRNEINKQIDKHFNEVMEGL